jgi:acyl-CoA oxidase
VTESGTYESSISSPSKRFFTMLGTLVGGRIAVASAGLSASKVAVTIALRYATARRQFGKTSEVETLLLEYPSHKRRLLPHLANAYASHFALEVLRAQYVSRKEGDDGRGLEALAACLKALITWDSVVAIRAARESCGGQGYLAVNRLADLASDAEIFTTFEGDNTVLMQLCAKNVLSEFAKASAGPIGFAELMAGKFMSAIAQKNPITSRATDSVSLRDVKRQLELFRAREDTIVFTAARRIQARRSAKVEANLALRQVQEHLLSVAHAHAERVRLEAFVHAEQAASDELRPLLGSLRSLHALAMIEKNAAFYLAEGLIEGSQFNAVRREVEVLMNELSLCAHTLTSAFGIPDACLAAPIAFSDPAHPRW